MKNICIPLAEGFEEIEAITLIDVLRRAGFNVTTCCLQKLEVCGSHQISLLADTTLDEALQRCWDLVVLPGGMPGTSHLRDDDRIGRLLHKTLDEGSYIGAICAAPIALARFGLLQNRRATSYPGFAEQMPGVLYSEDRIVVDGNILTSRAPGTAMEFALALVALLAGKTKAETLSKQMLAQ